MTIKKGPISKSIEPSLEETLFAFRHKLKSMLREEAYDFKCPISHIDTLSYIADSGTPSMKEIADHLKITPPSATAIVETMQKKNLITRVTNNKDRRTIRVSLTPKAWKFFKSLHSRKIIIINKMLSKLNDSDRKQFIRILNILIKD
ncbi:MAG TPA: MarR family transcriptional regulator [Candidatus Paceibacterota bacterium]|jgi:DNA-binding MarR family transcriptional regulator|nr:MarR family transcriptional regulator [Candidatus Paceibacterota bacterium]